MDCEDESVEEHDKYAFFLGSAIRSEDPDQFLTVYDSIIPKTLPEATVEHIKERARAIAGLDEKEFNELVLNARDYSLAQDRQKMSSSASSKEAFDDLPYIDDEEDEHEDDDSTDDSRSPPKNDRLIPPFTGVLKPPDLDEEFDVAGGDSGVFNISKATGNGSLDSGSDKQDDSDTDIPYCRLESCSSATPVASVNNQPYDEIHRIDSDSGSQLDVESPRSDISLSSSTEGRANVCEVEMETFRTTRTRSYGSIDASSCIHKHLYRGGGQSFDHGFSSMKESQQDDYEFDIPGLADRVPDDEKNNYGRQGTSYTRLTNNKTSTGVDEAVKFPFSTLGRSDASGVSNKGLLARRDWKASPNISYLSPRSNSRSLDGTSSLQPFQLNDDDKKRKKKKKGSKDDNDLPSSKDRFEIDVNGNPITIGFKDYRNNRELKSLTSSKTTLLDTSSLTPSNNDGEDNGGAGNGQKSNSKKSQKKKCREKEVHPEKEEGYIGDKDIDFILNALKENEKTSKPKRVASGQRDTMALQTVSKIEKSDVKNVKNNKSEKKQKQHLVHVSTCLNNESLTGEESVVKPVSCEVNNLYGYVQLKNSVVTPTPCTTEMGALNGKLDSSDLVQVIVHESEPENNCNLSKELVSDTIHVPTNETASDAGEKLGKLSDSNETAVNTSVNEKAKESLKVELPSNISIDSDESAVKESLTSSDNVIINKESKFSDTVKNNIDIESNCDKCNFDHIEVKEDLKKNGPKMDKYGDYYIFTDVDIQKVDRDAEFCPVVHKKKKRTTAKEPAPLHSNKGGNLSVITPRTTNVVADSYVNYRELNHRSNTDTRKFIRSVTPPPSSQSIDNQKNRDLSPSAFPALRRSAASKGKAAITEGRRNSTGDVAMEAAAIRSHDDSDLESVKSLPAASQVNDTSPGLPRPIISYAKVAASPKPHMTSPMSPPSSDNSELCSSDTSPARHQTVWKGNVRERRHSLGSSPEAPTEEAKLVDSVRPKSGSQTCLAVDCACSKAGAGPDSICDSLVTKSNLADNPCAKTAELAACNNNDRKTGSVLPSSTSKSNKTHSVKSPVLGCSEINVPAVSCSLDSVIYNNITYTNSTSSSQRQLSKQDSANSLQFRNTCSVETGYTELISIDKTGHNTGITSAPGKGSKGSHPSAGSTVLKIPPNNGKKFKQSVIFLDKRLAGPPQDLGITFGFEPDLEGSQVMGNLKIAVATGEDDVNVLSHLPETQTRSSPKNDLSAPVAAAALTPNNTTVVPKPTQANMAKQTDPGSLPLKGLTNVQNSVKLSPQPASCTPEVAQLGLSSVPANRQMPSSCTPRTFAPDLTKQANKGVYAVPALNGVVMSVVQPGDKSSPLSSSQATTTTLSHLQPPGSCIATGSPSNKLTDLGILYSSQVNTYANWPAVPTPVDESTNQHLDSINCETNPATSSSSMSRPASDISSTLIPVVYGKSIPLICSTTSSIGQSGSTNKLTLSSDMSCETTAQLNGPQKVIRFQMEEPSKGKFNWEEAAKFLKKEWDKILTQKEKNPDSVLMYSCNSAC